MSDQFSANFPPLVSREQAGNAIARALSLFVGRGRRYSVKELANATGVKDRMIECAKLAPDNVDYRPLPDWALLSISKFLGSAFTVSWLKLADQAAFDLPDEEVDPSKLAISTANDAANVVRIAMDGISGDEADECEDVGSRMMSHGAQLVAAAKAAR